MGALSGRCEDYGGYGGTSRLLLYVPLRLPADIRGSARVGAQVTGFTAVQLEVVVWCWIANPDPLNVLDTA